jgi:mono/diheme cytochrome c family protein
LRTIHRKFSRCSALIAFLASIVCIGNLSEPATGQAQNKAAVEPGVAISVRLPVPGARAFYSAAKQDQEQAPPSASPRPKPVEMPDGDGKAIAVANCQACHRLGNVTGAHKSLDDWRDTVTKMIDYGANVPPDKVETLVQYLARNFGPKTDVPAADAQTAPNASAPSAEVPPGAPAKPKAATVEMPDGEGKAIAIADCQACHRLGNVTSAHKSLDDWRDTVNKMIDYGVTVPPDKVETLVQYLAKNFGPKPDTPDPAAPAGSESATSSPEK